MNAYQNFLDFFSMHNKERLDGLSESYFTAMTEEERGSAFNYLLKRVGANGTEESVNGLFRAAPLRAVATIKQLLKNDSLSGEAQISAAWNLYQEQSDSNLISVFVHFLNDPDPRLRAKAVYFAPAVLTAELKAGLQGMIRTETVQLPRIHAVDKLLACYGVTEESVEPIKYLSIYRDLHNEDSAAKERAFKQLDNFLK